MASPTQKESKSNSPLSFNGPEILGRTVWAEEALSEYLGGGDEVILEKLGYPQSIRGYIKEGMHLIDSALHIRTDKGIVFRMRDDATGEGKHAMIESPKPEVIQFTLTAPTRRYLNAEQRREVITEDQLKELGKLFVVGSEPEYLLRLFVLRDSCLTEGLDGFRNFVEPTHLTDKLPRFGLGSEKRVVARVLHAMGQMSLYEALRTGEDIHVYIKDPGNVTRDENWRILSAPLGKLSVVGRMVNRTPNRMEATAI